MINDQFSELQFTDIWPRFIRKISQLLDNLKWRKL